MNKILINAVLWAGLLSLLGCGEKDSGSSSPTIPDEINLDSSSSSNLVDDSVAMSSCSSANKSSSSVAKTDRSAVETSSSITDEYDDSIVKSSSSSESSKEKDEVQVSSSSVVSSSSSVTIIAGLEFVKIGNQEWSTTNLNVNVDGSFCYKDIPENCEKYGRLYTWSMAMGIDTRFDKEQYGGIEEPFQGICPDGTHLPSHQEWAEVNAYVAKNPDYMSYFTNQLGGARDYHGDFVDEGSYVSFFSSTEYDVTGTTYPYLFAWLWSIHDGDKNFGKDNSQKHTGTYVRCIKGQAAPNDNHVYPSSSSVVLSSSSSSFDIFIKECATEPANMDVNTIFENQKKAALPDTVEKLYRVYINSANVVSMTMSVSVITAGPTKSLITSRTNSYGGVYTETVWNDGQVKVTDLKTGKRHPSSYAEYDLTDYNRLFGTAADYSQVELEGSLWKMAPIDETKPTLYYSSCEERIVKASQVAGDTTNVYTYAYYDEGADFPGAVSKMLIERSVYMKDASMRDYLKSDTLRATYEISIVSIKKRSVLPAKMFDLY